MTGMGAERTSVRQAPETGSDPIPVIREDRRAPQILSSGARVAMPNDTLQMLEEIDHGGVNVGGSFLLGPMAAARQHDRAPELGNKFC